MNLVNNSLLCGDIVFLCFYLFVLILCVSVSHSTLLCSSTLYWLHRYGLNCVFFLVLWTLSLFYFIIIIVVLSATMSWWNKAYQYWHLLPYCPALLFVHFHSYCCFCTLWANEWMNEISVLLRCELHVSKSQRLVRHLCHVGVVEHHV